MRRDRLMRVARVAWAPVALGAAALAVGLALGGCDFLSQHLWPLLFAAFTVGACLKLGALLVAGVLRGALRALRRPRLGEAGAASAEFAIVVIPFMLMLTGLMQLALASLGRVLVSYAAFCAARAAIVLIPEKLESGSGSSATEEAPGTVGNGKNERNDFAISRKAALMRNAASYPLIAASPAIDTVVEDAITHLPSYLEGRLEDGITDALDKTGAGEALAHQIAQQIGDLASGPLEKFRDQLTGLVASAGGNGYSVDRALDVGFGASTDGAGGALLRSLRKLVYARMATAVVLLDADGNPKSSFQWNDPVRARVTHLFYCQIPLANRFAGRAFYNLPDNVVQDVSTAGMHGLSIGLPGWFLPITAEHTLTNQGKR